MKRFAAKRMRVLLGGRIALAAMTSALVGLCAMAPAQYEVIKLERPAGSAGIGFGWSVTLDGDEAIGVSRRFSCSHTECSDTHESHHFTRSNGVWTLVEALLPPSVDAGPSSDL